MDQQETRAGLIKKRGYRKDVAGDTLTLYLSNYPVSAKWLAERIGDNSKELVELCCAVGITLEYLAPAFKKVTGVDIDHKILESGRENLNRAGVIAKTTLIQGDVSDVNLLKTLKADVVIYDIPYWYPHKYHKYSSEEHDEKNPDLAELMANIRDHISKNIVIFAPPEMTYKYFKGALGECEYVQIYIGEKYDRNYVFFGNLIQEPGEVVVMLPAGK